MVAYFGVFFTTHPLGKSATHFPALRTACHAALLLLAGWQPASSSRLAWRTVRSAGKYAQLRFLG
ncbi:MAG: hypothetical protein LBE15_01455 [Burkholderiales bacterium]|nr:hypothetical protein [Burkholderiales bacterium]